MRPNETVIFNKNSNISDGMGGWITSKEEVGRALCLAAPVTAEVALREYGLVTTTSIKLYIPDSIPEDFEEIVFRNKTYSLLQLADFGKLKMLLLELVE